jgi:hypothetical protein
MKKTGLTDKGPNEPFRPCGNEKKQKIVEGTPKDRHDETKLGKNRHIVSNIVIIPVKTLAG